MANESVPSAPKVIPAPGTRFLPGVPAAPVPPQTTTGVSASVTTVPPGGAPPAPAAPPPPPGPIINPIRPDEPIGTTIRKLSDDIRLLAIHQPAETETAGRALTRVTMLANAINAQPPPEQFKPVLPRFFVVERELAEMQETIEPVILKGRDLAKDTGRPVIVAQAVLVLSQMRDVTESWL